MSEKDLDIAIEKCERIMEFDTRTLENPESENGHIFEKVYDLLQFLRQLQFATDTNVVGNLIDRQAALDALTEWYDNDDDKRSAKDVIRELPQEQQWSCGKPKHIGRYIVTYWSRLHDDEQCRVQIMRFQNGHWVYPRHIPEWVSGEIEEEVLAWCELPTPYREGGQDGKN